jgi:hypothetical protein
MQTIPDIPVDDTAWVDVNTTSGIAVGAKMLITLKSVTWCRLYEGATPPSVDSKDGILLTNTNFPYATSTILSDSLKIWAISAREGRSLKLSVQPL